MSYQNVLMESSEKFDLKIIYPHHLMNLKHDIMSQRMLNTLEKQKSRKAVDLFFFYLFYFFLGGGGGGRVGVGLKLILEKNEMYRKYFK